MTAWTCAGTARARSVVVFPLFEPSLQLADEVEVFRSPGSPLQRDEPLQRHVAEGAPVEGGRDRIRQQQVVGAAADDFTEEV
jgi:hypothetical protein